MDKKEIIEKTIVFVKDELSDAEGGHDWFHIERVWNNAKHIAKNENVDLFIVELGALLHDIADSKFHNGDEEVGPRKAKNFLTSLNVDGKTITQIENIIKHISFAGGNHKREFNSKELDVVQDADKLDAIGAIGIARTFSFGGHFKRKIYDPNVKPKLDMTKEEYKKSETHTINHFYEKLLLLKDKMNTKYGKEIALKRHQYMEKFLEQFYKEWKGEL